VGFKVGGCVGYSVSDSHSVKSFEWISNKMAEPHQSYLVSIWQEKNGWYEE
jgi:hypothetical protein